MIQCTLDACPTASGQVVECLEACSLTDDVTACVTTEGQGVLLAYDQCLKPLADSGACNGLVSVCGAQF